MIKNPYYQGPVSDHFDGMRFFNPEGLAPAGFTDVIKWQLSGGRKRWPHSVEPFHAPVKPSETISGNDLRVTMIGHASLLIQGAGINILTDPVWSHRVSPVRFAGPKRVVKPGIHLEDLPPIDIVLVTHNHYDHLDLATLKQIHQAHKPHIITPLGNDRIIHRAIAQANVTAVDWGDRVKIRDGITIDAEPCHHWSARGTLDRRMALWAAFVVSTPVGRIYVIGDTGFHHGINYRAVAEKYGGFRLAALPIGAYEPRWFMKSQHQNPEEAVMGMILCKAAYAVGHHFGTFQLTDEAIDDPVHEFHAALQKHGVAPSRFRALRIGETFDVP